MMLLLKYRVRKMRLQKIQKIKPAKQLSKLQISIFAGVFAVTGGIIIFSSYAAGFSTYFEAENATSTSPATVVNDSNASGGSALKFASGGSSSCPLPAFPDASCTGVPAGITLTNYTGSSTPAAGQEINGKIITQCLNITQPGVVIKNSRFTAQCSWVVDSWVDTSNQSSWTQIIDSEITCINAGNGIGERGVIVRRVEISGCENGMDLDQHGLVEDSYIHTLDEGPNGDGHGDGIQSAVFNDITIRHNTIIGRSGDLTNPGLNATSAIITPAGSTHDILIENNFLAGGASTIYCPPNSPVNVRVQNNTFAHRPGPLGAAFSYTANCTTGTIWSGNVNDLGQPVTAGS
jgi:hypothetical protein